MQYSCWGAHCVEGNVQDSMHYWFSGGWLGWHLIDNSVVVLDVTGVVACFLPCFRCNSEPIGWRHTFKCAASPIGRASVSLWRSHIQYEVTRIEYGSSVPQMLRSGQCDLLYCGGVQTADTKGVSIMDLLAKFRWNQPVMRCFNMLIIESAYWFYCFTSPQAWILDQQRRHLLCRMKLDIELFFPTEIARISGNAGASTVEMYQLLWVRCLFWHRTINLVCTETAQTHPEG